ALLCGEINRGRCALLAGADVAQIYGLPEPALRIADQEDRLARGLESKRRRFGEIVEHTDAADRGRRQDRPSVGLVVERDVAGDDREVERAAGLANALQAADELAHDFGRSGLPKLRLSVMASGLPPTAVMLRQASATACLPPSNGSASQ